jgi:hypothetical protein
LFSINCRFHEPFRRNLNAPAVAAMTVAVAAPPQQQQQQQQIPVLAQVLDAEGDENDDEEALLDANDF